MTKPAPRAPRRCGRWLWTILLVGLTAAAAGGAYYGIRRAVLHWCAASCREALRAKDWDQLERSVARWRAWDPHKAEPIISLAEAANQRNQLQRAVEVLDELPDDDPMTPAALLVRSSMLFAEMNRPIESVETLERAVRLDPGLVEARRRLIYFYAFTLQRRKMVRAAYDAIRHGCDLPETYVYLISQDWLSFANAYAENTKWLRGNPDEELFLVAQAIYRIRTRMSGEMPETGPLDEEGVRHFRKLAGEYFKKYPNNLELLVLHLEESSTSGDVGGVARLLSGSPAEAAEDNRFWRYLGWLHNARREFAEAEAAYRTAMSLNCYDYVSRHQLAAVLRQMRRFDEVKSLEELSRQGKSLRRQILEMKNVAKVPLPIARRMAQYATQCGDFLVAGKLSLRIEQMSGKGSAVLGPF